LSPKTTVSLSGTGGLGNSDDQTLSGLDIFDGNRVKTNHEDFTSLSPDHPFNYTTTLQLARQLDTTGREFTVDLDYSRYKNDPKQNNFATLEDAGNNFISQADALLLEKRRLDIYSAKMDYTRPWQNGRMEAGLKSSYVRAENDNTYYDQVNGQNLVDTSQSDYSVNSEQINAAYVDISRSTLGILKS
jgi:hypothetical protein